MNKSKDSPLIGLIASKDPVAALEATVASLFRGGASRVIVVNDGSSTATAQAVFKRIEKKGAEVIHLPKNVGKAKALRVGFRTLPKDCIIVQTDDDTLAGDLTGPARMIREGKTDIVDIRIEAVRTNSLLGVLQELNYWTINAITKRIQGFFDARVWMSGASVMYTHKAGRTIVLRRSHSMTEDTEGLFRARSKGFRVKYYSKHDGQFLTLVPEDLSALHKQWRRWATGNGQVLSIYGLGGGSIRVATINAIAWMDIVLPIPVSLRYGFVTSLVWGFSVSALIGLVGAVRLKRALLAPVGILLPFMSVLWAVHAFQGLYLAYKLSKSGKKTPLTWVSPERTGVLELARS
jgi:cellulose synthase/poly-beta-1,6-N-acetylglucosamine synthase-like glycosyltransferase